MILLASQYFYPTIGGVENSIFFIAKELEKLKKEVLIVSFDECNTKKEDKQLGLNIIRFGFKKSKLPSRNYKNLILASKKALKSLTNKFEDIELIISRSACITNGFLELNQNIPIKYIPPTISKLNKEGLYEGIKNKRFLKYLILSALKQNDYLSLRDIEQKVFGNSKVDVVVFSKLMKREIQQEYIKNRPIRVLPPGVNVDFFKPTESTFENYKPFILFVGRLAKSKNITPLIEAMVHINDYNLVLVGEGPDKKQFQNQIEALNLKNKVFFEGRQKERLPEYYSNASLTILPSKFESFGQVILESLSCGTPVIGFGNHPNYKTAINEILSHPRQGHIISDDGTMAIVKAIESLGIHINNEAVKIKNRDYILGSYQWGRFVKELIQND